MGYRDLRFRVSQNIGTFLEGWGPHNQDSSSLGSNVGVPNLGNYKDVRALTLATQGRSLAGDVSKLYFGCGYGWLSKLWSLLGYPKY